MTTQSISIPPKPQKGFNIFVDMPLANQDTFDQALPTSVDQDGNIQRMVFYSPNFINIGILDNSKGSASTTFSKTFSRGFSSTNSTTLGYKSSAEATVGFLKASVELSLSVTFSESWNESQSQTTSFTVPAGKRSFLYQGTLLGVILKWNGQGPESENFQYIEAPFVTETPVAMTSDQPINGTIKPI
jgi:hypothetical protein